MIDLDLCGFYRRRLFKGESSVTVPKAFQRLGSTGLTRNEIKGVLINLKNHGLITIKRKKNIISTG